MKTTLTTILALALLGCLAVDFALQRAAAQLPAGESDFELVLSLIRAKPNLGNAPEGRDPTSGRVDLPGRKLEIKGAIRVLPGLDIRGAGSETVVHSLQGPLFIFTTDAGNGYAARETISNMSIWVEQGDAIVLGDNFDTDTKQPTESSFLSVRDCLFNVPNGTAIKLRSPRGPWTYRSIIERCSFRDVWQCVDIWGVHGIVRDCDLVGNRPRKYAKYPPADFNLEGGWQYVFDGNHVSAGRSNPLLRAYSTRVTARGNDIEPDNDATTQYIELWAADLSIDQIDGWPHKPARLRWGSNLFVETRVYSDPVTERSFLVDESTKTQLDASGVPVLDSRGRPTMVNANSVTVAGQRVKVGKIK